MALKKAGLVRFKREIGNAVDRGVETAAGYVADLASQLAPYDADADHKHLNESIVVRGEKGSRKRQVVAGDGLPDIRAIVQEYGSVDQPAQPYLTPAAEAIDVKREVQKEIQALVRRSTT
jgi:HK97 gp10 family phage protein